MTRWIMGSGLRWLWISLLVFSLDWSTKQWILNHFDTAQVLPITAFFNLVLVQNRGAAFSLLADYHSSHWLLVVAALLISLWLLYTLYIEPASSVLSHIAYALILGGAWGNLLDRLRYGAVIDFIDCHIASWHWPAFNLADSAIFLGVALVIFCSISGRLSLSERVSHSSRFPG